MSNISFFKKIKLFREFKRVIDGSRYELENNLNIRIDRAYRLYTIVNVPKDFIGESFSLNKNDYDKISEVYVKEYINAVSSFLDSRGLTELYTVYETVKVDKFSWKIVIGYSLFKSNEYYNKIYFRYLPISILLVILGLIKLFV